MQDSRWADELMSEHHAEDYVQLRVVYTDPDDAPLLYSNQFAVQHDQDELVLTMGRLIPPLLLGTPEEKREQARQLENVEVRILARYAMTRARLVQLISVLQKNVQTYNEQQRESNDHVN